MAHSAASTRVRESDTAESASAEACDPSCPPSPARPDIRNRSRQDWRSAFRAVRAETERRAALLSAEDQVIQSMPDASPTKWHRAHVTWFFEQFLLRPHLASYRVFDERFGFLYNSYYVSA